MSWIKRNLKFVIGAILTLAALGYTGFYCFSSWNLNKKNLDDLNGAFQTLDSIARENPNPGNEQINNTEIARKYQAQVRQVIDKLEKYFAPIPPIPQGGSNIADVDFADALNRTIGQLNEAAARASVSVPSGYNFTFAAQTTKAVFAPGSLELLATQLGEVKAICNILFNAKINSLYNLRRERVSADDVQSGVQTDYLEIRSVTNDLAVLTPYEVKFACFPADLAGVLAGFATQPHGFVVKTLNVEPDSFGGGMGEGGGMTPAMMPRPSASGLQDVVSEKRLRVTMMLNVVKLQPKKTTE